MFVSGGENIQPEEIERHLERLAGVRQAVVVPVPDAEYGRRPVAFVRGEREEATAALRSALSDEHPRYKLPDAIHPLPDSVVEGQLKVDYEALRERARTLHGGPADGAEQDP
jgi:O-succinylbenzoic acid--CoA ligase